MKIIGFLCGATVALTSYCGAAVHPASAARAPLAACVLHNRDWARVSLKPRRYVGCRVDVAGSMYQVQVQDGYVDYNTDLDPNGAHEWSIFAADYADNPPALGDHTYVEITGRITDAQAGYSTLSGGFMGYVPQIRVSAIKRIAARRALAMGMPAT